MLKRLLIAMVAELIRATIFEYVNSIRKVTRRNDTILMLTRMKEWLEQSSSKIKRTVGSILPFDRDEQ